MDASFPIAQKHLLAYEGGFSNHPSDPGGPTLEGITQRVYDAWRRSKGRARQKLSAAMRFTPAWIAERDTIYRTQYWMPPRCDELPAGVDAVIYDCGVNSGPGRSRCCSAWVKDDGVIGDITLAAVRRRVPAALVHAICAERLAFLKRLKTWPVFGKGWACWVADVLAYASALAVARTVPMPRNAPVIAKGEVPAPKAAKTAAKAGPVLERPRPSSSSAARRLAPCSALQG